MKKLLALLLCLLMLVGCGSNKTENTTENGDNNTTTDTTVEETIAEKESVELLGGWQINPDLPPMNDAVFDKATKDLTGVGYSPLFLLGSQPVAGENLAYLCYATTVTANPTTTFKVVKVFNDLENNESSVTEVVDFYLSSYLDSDGETTPEGLMGGWQDNENLPNMLNDKAKVMFTKATEGLLGVNYSPVAVLATQVVAGVNYAILATGKTVTANPVNHLYVIKIYEDLQGNAEITNICGIDLSSFIAK